MSRMWRRAIGLVVPGAAQLLRGGVLTGIALSALWLGAIVAWQPGLLVPLTRFLGIDLRLDLIRFGPVPVAFGLDPWSVLGISCAAAVWLTANLPVLRGSRA